MKKIEKRTVVCLILTLILLLGVGLFVVRFFLNGGSWASFAANRHLYNSQGQLSVGRVLDRDGDVLSWVDESGSRQYYANQTVRMATLHAVGDPNGAIGTSALVAFADQLSGYNFLTGADNPFGQGNDLYLTLDARLNYEAYQALGGRRGAVGVYNYETGEILCMVSTPTFDPADPPEIQEGDERYEGVYVNRFLSSTFTPGSVFKTVTLTAAIENLPDLFGRTFTCTGWDRSRENRPMMDLALMTYRPERTSTSQAQRVAASTNFFTSLMEERDTKKVCIAGTSCGLVCTIRRTADKIGAAQS